MGPKTENLIGQRFNRLVVVSYSHKENALVMWNCVCDCGIELKVRAAELKRGHTKSCGCLHKEKVIKRFTKHGHIREGRATSTYNTWGGMLQRCYNPKNPGYKNYGGRGIEVCERWHAFKNFLEDMGERPEGMSLDRKDNSGNYEQGNCRWTTRNTQNNNTRANKYIYYKGERRSVAQWAHEKGMRANTLWCRLHTYGWSEEKALTTKVRKMSMKGG